MHHSGKQRGPHMMTERCQRAAAAPKTRIGHATSEGATGDRQLNTAPGEKDRPPRLQHRTPCLAQHAFPHGHKPLDACSPKCTKHRTARSSAATMQRSTFAQECDAPEPTALATCHYQKHVVPPGHSTGQLPPAAAVALPNRSTRHLQPAAQCGTTWPQQRWPPA